MMKFQAYVTGSILATIGTIYYAYQTRRQFYSSVVFLSSNKFSIMMLANMGICLTLLLGKLTKSIFLGNLREFEVEILFENSRYAVTETLLALTVFREELSLRVAVLFVALLFVKAFHWLAQARVEHMEQTAMASQLDHVRLVALMLGLLLVDCSIVGACVSLWKGPSVLILFGFEFAILAAGALTTFIRYLLHVVDMRVEGTWHNKASYIFLLEFLNEVVRFLFYVIFFGIVFMHYGMPLHIVRDLWSCYSKLRRRFKAYTKYRQLTSNMNERFPDATPEQLQSCENTCIICRDHMDAGKLLPCAHIFHFQCLRMWLQHQQTCPTCRAEIPSAMPTPSRPPASAQATPQNPPGQQEAGTQAAQGAFVPAQGAVPHQPVPAGAGNFWAPPITAPGITAHRVYVQPAATTQTAALRSTIYGNPVQPSAETLHNTQTPGFQAQLPTQFSLYRVLRQTWLRPLPSIVGESDPVLTEGTMLCKFEQDGDNWIKVVDLSGKSGWVNIIGCDGVPDVENQGSPALIPFMPCVSQPLGETGTAEEMKDPTPEPGFPEEKETTENSKQIRFQSSEVEGAVSISNMRESLERLHGLISKINTSFTGDQKFYADYVWTEVQNVSKEAMDFMSSSQQSNMIDETQLRSQIFKVQELERELLEALQNQASQEEHTP